MLKSKESPVAALSMGGMGDVKMHSRPNFCAGNDGGIHFYVGFSLNVFLSNFG